MITWQDMPYLSQQIFMASRLLHLSPLNFGIIALDFNYLEKKERKKCWHFDYNKEQQAYSFFQLLTSIVNTEATFSKLFTLLAQQKSMRTKLWLIHALL